MLPSDTKSQNSDYGSFCQTPSDTIGNNGEPPSGSHVNSPDHTDHQGDTQRQPLLPPMADDETSSDDEVGANSSGIYLKEYFEEDKNSPKKFRKKSTPKIRKIYLYFLDTGSLEYFEFDFDRGSTKNGTFKNALKSHLKILLDAS